MATGGFVPIGLKDLSVVKLPNDDEVFIEELNI